MAVFFRSHLNPTIFKRHPFRFIAAPLLLYGAMMLSVEVMIIATVLVVFWDVYHSGLQTFGLARIYDRNCGNDPAVGRRLDYWLNHLLYAGPILGGASCSPISRSSTSSRRSGGRSSPASRPS